MNTYLDTERYLRDALQHFARGEYSSAEAYVRSALGEIEAQKVKVKP